MEAGGVASKRAFVQTGISVNNWFPSAIASIFPPHGEVVWRVYILIRACSYTLCWDRVKCA